MNNFIFPPAPVELTARSQLEGLDRGAFILQPKWDGRRAIAVRGEPLRYRSGKLVNRRPWSKLEIPDADRTLDLELMRDTFHVLDVVFPGPFYLRQRIAHENNLIMDGIAVSSVGEINKYLADYLDTGYCDGVVLKRVVTPYVGSKHGQPVEYNWLKVKKRILL